MKTKHPKSPLTDRQKERVKNIVSSLQDTFGRCNEVRFLAALTPALRNKFKAFHTVTKHKFYYAVTQFYGYSTATSKDAPVYYTYVLLDPRKPGPFYYGHWKFSHEPFYVGKGSGSRVNSHVASVELNARKEYSPAHSSLVNPHKYYKIQKILKSGLEVLHRIVRSGITDTESYSLEEKLISDIGRGKDGPLTNLNAGGLGGSKSFKHSEATKQKIREVWASKSKKDMKAINEKRSEAKLNMAPEKRAAWIEQIKNTLDSKREDISRNAKLRIASTTTPAQRRRSARKAWRGRDMEAWSVKLKDSWAKRTPEQIAARTAKFQATLRLKNGIH